VRYFLKVTFSFVNLILLSVIGRMQLSLGVDSRPGRPQPLSAPGPGGRADSDVMPASSQPLIEIDDDNVEEGQKTFNRIGVK
jgi:hypothetical protein